MAKRYKLKELETKHGDLNKLIPKLVNDLTQSEAARRLETSQATISRWLKDNGYQSRIVWEKVN